MSKALIEKLRKAREQNVTVGGHTFTVRRPTDGELAYLPDSRTFEFVKRFVVGWDLKENDFDPSGTSDPVPFDPLLWAEWAADHSEVWEPLGALMLEAYQKHKEQTGADVKN